MQAIVLTSMARYEPYGRPLAIDMITCSFSGNTPNQRFFGKFVSHWVKSLPIVLLGREGIEQSISIIIIGPKDKVQVLR